MANTIKDVIDDFEFRSKVFLEHIPRCFQLLYTLLEQSKECDTKVRNNRIVFSRQKNTSRIVTLMNNNFQMQVLTVLSFIIERVGWEIAPFFDSLVNYLPLLWQHSDSHNMLRCAIVTVLTQIVRVRIRLSCTKNKYTYCTSWNVNRLFYRDSESNAFR